MGLPRTLTQFNVFLDGVSCIGEATKVKLPALKRKTEEAQQGIHVDLGLETIEIEHSYGAFMREIFAGFGIAKVDGAMLRFAGAYARPDTGTTDAVEIVVRGRHTEIDAGDAEAGKKAEFTVKTPCTYYKLTVNSEVWVEIDRINHIEIINGTDRLEGMRSAIGL